MKLSPMMQQYQEIKDKHRDCILFFRLGDFYEMFFDDAILASKELELTLTGKNCGQEERAPMCGVPFHSAETYIARLVERGYKVAICEQVEDPSVAKGLVKRDVIQIVTPGTVTSQTMLNEKENNYLASIFCKNQSMALSYCDISTGELYTTELKDDKNTFENIINELVKVNAREIIVNEDFETLYDLIELKNATNGFVQILNNSYYSIKSAEEGILAQFGTATLASMKLHGYEIAILSLGGLLSYLLETQKQNLKQLTDCQFYEIGKHMALDKATLRNLEITETLYDKKIQGSLLGVLDKTQTAMGSRKLKQWLREPLNNSDQINMRLDAVEELFLDPILLNNLEDSLKQVYDFERLSGRIGSGNANGKDLIALKKSVAILPEVKNCLSYSSSALLISLNDHIDPLEEVYTMIEGAICEEPPFTIKDGDLIKSGFSKELDDLKYSIKDAKQWIANLENSEKERTGIKNLKVGFNKVFGYYIEITKSNIALVPDDYIRKQTLVNNERYITPELKEMEGIVLNAETKINQLEYNIFTELRLKIQKFIVQIQQTSRSIAILDVLCSFAKVSIQSGYTKPLIDTGYEIQIEKGRHPVIEQMTSDGLFVSNDTYLNNQDSAMLIITGPNMAGKSTYMRQTALIVLMAQSGCFVPCENAHIGVVDRIFTRIGASDNLSMGQSTFFVEMNELAYILKCSSERSLIILDEIGRGTSTYDGLSIAWAVVDYLCRENRRIRTLFATHYHELTVLENMISGVKNLSIEVSEENGNIIFLHKIIPGSASRSYGIHVAKLAGVPMDLLNNAENKLSQLESSSNNDHLSPVPKCEEQLTFFMPRENHVIDLIKDIDLMNTTPAMAISILEKLKEAIDD